MKWSVLLFLCSVASAKTIALPSGQGGIGFDDLRYSPALGRVLAPAGRTGNLDLVDPKTGEVTAIGGFTVQPPGAGGHDIGVTSADEGDGFLVAADRTRTELVVVDPKRRAITATAKLAGEPDYVRWIAAKREIWVTEPDKEQIEIFAIEAGKPRAKASLPIKNGPESLVVDARRGRAYANLWSGSSVAIDLGTHKVAATWQNGCKGSRGIALDGEHGWLFVGCAEGKVTMLDVATGKLSGQVDTGAGVDIIDYSAKLKHVYAPGGKAGTLTIAAASAQGLKAVGTQPSPKGGHCCTADDQGHVFVCDPKAGALEVYDDKN